jgi:hypothetical protein
MDRRAPRCGHGRLAPRGVSGWNVFRHRRHAPADHLDIDRLRELYPPGRFEAADSAPTSSYRLAAQMPASWRTTGSAVRS